MSLKLIVLALLIAEFVALCKLEERLKEKRRKYEGKRVRLKNNGNQYFTIHKYQNKNKILVKYIYCGMIMERPVKFKDIIWD